MTSPEIYFVDLSYIYYLPFIKKNVFHRDAHASVLISSKINIHASDPVLISCVELLIIPRNILISQKQYIFICV